MLGKPKFTIVALMVVTSVVAIAMVLSLAGVLTTFLIGIGTLALAAMFLFSFESSPSGKTVSTDPVSILLTILLTPTKNGTFQI